MPSISVPTAILGAAAVGTAGSLIGSSQQAGAANNATNAQLGIYNQNQQLLNPYVQKGLGAYDTLNGLLGVGGNSATMQSNLENLPGYQFTLGQGLKSVQNGVTARGLGVSGAALKGAANYATGLADSNWQNYANALQNSANTGYGAGAAIAGVGANTGANVANSTIAAGNAAAAGTLGATNSIANSLPLYAFLNSGAGGGGSSSTGFDYNLASIP